MALVPGGELRLGDKDGKPQSASTPAHLVELDAFCVDLHEVTVAAYKACSDRGACKRAAGENEWPRIRGLERVAFDPECNGHHPEERAQHPINCVTWEMADIYCKAHDKRLPTEAEWERAARGSDGRHYPWGREDPDIKRLNACGSECVAWHDKHRMKAKPMFEADDDWPVTAPVGSFPRGDSPYGVHDLAGNLWEWVADYYAPYSDDKKNNPQGPDKGRERVVRGGAFNVGDPAWVRSSYRHHEAPATVSWVIGFRCAAMPKP
jgi:formylglycine-generating enzyme required for sulfatase activity